MLKDNALEMALSAPTTISATVCAYAPLSLRRACQLMSVHVLVPCTDFCSPTTGTCGGSGAECYSRQPEVYGGNWVVCDSPGEYLRWSQNLSHQQLTFVPLLSSRLHLQR